MNTVKLISTSSSPEMSPEELILYCARVSSKDQSKSDTKLLEYLIRNQHWSPFEMVSATLEIVTTRDIARQILRHRSFSFQEFSQRYSDQIEFAPPREARYQDHKNRQNSHRIDPSDEVHPVWQVMQNDIIGHSERAYHQALEMGIAKEVARSVLPEGLTQSRLYMAGTLRSWIHYIQLRSGNGTQLEHRDIAILAQSVLQLVFPNVMEALDALHD